jgi:hypothetical protein
MFVATLVTAAALPQTKGQDAMEITGLPPFTHIAYIPESADLSSIKIESIKSVKVPIRQRSVTNAPPVPAYEVTYSFRGEPLASDEYGNTGFTFSVDFRPDELGPELRSALSAGPLRKQAAAGYFDFTVSRDSLQQTVIDPANSAFCDGNYRDGNWIPVNSKCVDRIAHRTVTGDSPYIAVKVNLAAPPVEGVEVSRKR